jgi:large subunit ribosomal protein L21
MYAIVKTGSKQYRVERGQTLLVERLPEAEGASVALEPVLYRSQETVFDAAALATVTGTAKVVEHVRGPKLRVFKFKPKRGYKRRTGHRQELTRLQVTEIALAGAGKAAAPKPAAAPTPAAAPRAAAPEPAVAPEAVAPEPAVVPEPAAAPEAAMPEPAAAAKPAREAMPAAAKPAPAKDAPAKEDSDGS